jgi:N-acetylmuramoyl-L-alanine amidase CwlA
MKILLLALLLTSCASVKKFEKRYDSTGTTKIDSVHLVFYDSVTKIIEKEQVFTKSITIYDTIRIAKDSIIVVPKIVTKWIYETREKESNNSLIKKDTIAFNRTETAQISIVDKNKVTTQNNFWKALIGLIIAIILILAYWNKLWK